MDITKIAQDLLCCLVVVHSAFSSRDVNPCSRSVGKTRYMLTWAGQVWARANAHLVFVFQIRNARSSSKMSVSFGYGWRKALESISLQRGGAYGKKSKEESTVGGGAALWRHGEPRLTESFFFFAPGNKASPQPDLSQATFIEARVKEQEPTPMGTLFHSRIKQTRDDKMADPSQSSLLTRHASMSFRG